MGKVFNDHSSKKNCLRGLLRLVFYLMIFHLGPSLNAKEDEVRENVNDPSMTTRCKRLLSYRNQQVLLKQKSTSLIKRASRVEKIIPSRKVSVKKRMELILKQLHQEQAILDFQISNLEEDIVRKGCPGINL